MAADESQRNVPESSDEVQATSPGSNTSRRRFVTRAVAVTTGVVAAGYVKPSLKGFGVPNALARLSSREEPPPRPPRS